MKAMHNHNFMRCEPTRSYIFSLIVRKFELDTKNPQERNSIQVKNVPDYRLKFLTFLDIFLEIIIEVE